MSEGQSSLSDLEKLKATYVKERIGEASQKRLNAPDTTAAASQSTPPSTHPATWIMKRLSNVLSGRVGKPRMLEEK